MPTPVSRRDDACYADDTDDTSPANAPGTDGNVGAPSAASVAHALGVPAQQEGECDLIPDYVSLGVSARAVLSAGDTYTVDRYGNRYGSAAIGVATPGPSVSSMAGYLRDDAHPCVPPDEAKLESFLTGISRNETSAFGVAAGLTTSSGMTAHEFGIGTPGASLTMSYGWMVHDEKHGRGEP